MYSPIEATAATTLWSAEMENSAIVIGTQSFVDSGCKVGSQYLARALAESGWSVDYVATASSLFDVWGSNRHPRLIRVWCQSQDARGVQIERRLTEWAFRSPFPAVKQFLRWQWQLRAYSLFVPKRFREKEYGICISEVTPNMLYLPWVRAKLHVLRLNDWPPGFSHDLHPVVIGEMVRRISEKYFQEIWAVSKPLVHYAHSLNAHNNVFLVPNGVSPLRCKHAEVIERKKNSAVYVGEVGAWLDVDLLRHVACLMPDWQFDVFGPGSLELRNLPKNLVGRGLLERDRVPDVLSRYAVGLIPFVNINGRMDYVERPLKFYEYISADLGVASTDMGALRDGMGELAQYGNTAETFSNAIRKAQVDAANRPAGFGAAFIERNSWGNICLRVFDRLQELRST